MKKNLMSALCVLGLVVGSVQGYQVFEPKHAEGQEPAFVLICKTDEARADWLEYGDDSPLNQVQEHVNSVDHKLFNAGRYDFYEYKSEDDKRVKHECYKVEIVKRIEDLPLVSGAE